MLKTKNKERKHLINCLANQAGFTLLELLLSLLIITLIMGLMSGAINLAVKSWEAGDRLSLKNQRIRMLVRQMSDEIRSAHPLLVSMELDESEKQQYNAFIGDESQITFITTTSGLSNNTSISGLRAVSYRLEGDDGLVAYEATLDFQDFFKNPEGGHRLVFNPEVTSLSFRYLYIPPATGDDDEQEESHWVGSWDPTDQESNDIIEGKDGQELAYFAHLPAAVEISFTVSGNKTEETIPPLVLPIYAGKDVKAH